MAKASSPEPTEPSQRLTPSEAAKEFRAEKRARRQASKEDRRVTRAAMGGNKPWFVPVMLGLMIFGLVWTVVYYLSAGALPVASLGNWNLAIGFGFILAGFVMTTQWK